MVFEYRELGDGFYCEIRYVRQKTSLQQRKDVGKDVGKRNIIIDMIRNNPEITIPDIAKNTGFTTRTIERYIAELKTNGILERSGGRKRGHWIIIQE